MPNQQDASSGATTAPNYVDVLGLPSTPPPPPTAQPTLGGAPTVSATPRPGQGIALDSSGKISASVLTRTTRGVAVVAWPGGASISSGTIVTHALGTIPTGIQATMQTVVSGVATICPCQTATLTDTTFTVFAQTIDGSTPALNAAITVFWIASA